MFNPAQFEEESEGLPETFGRDIVKADSSADEDDDEDEDSVPGVVVIAKLENE